MTGMPRCSSVRGPQARRGGIMSQTEISGPRGRSRTARRRLWRALLGILVVALWGAGASTASGATTRVVSKTQSGANIYPTIQAAVNAANPSDWVLIEPGEY